MDLPCYSWEPERRPRRPQRRPLAELIREALQAVLDRLGAEPARA